MGDLALLLVHQEPQSALEELPDRAHHPLTGPLAPHEDVTNVGAASERAEPNASITLRSSTPGAPLFRTTFSSAIARFAGVAPASSSRLASAALAPRSFAVLRLTVCSRESLPADASDGPGPSPPGGLAATTNFSWRDLMLQNPSPPSLCLLSQASWLLRDHPTSPPVLSPRRCLLGPYRLRTRGDLLG